MSPRNSKLPETAIPEESVTQKEVLSMVSVFIFRLKVTSISLSTGTRSPRPGVTALTLVNGIDKVIIPPPAEATTTVSSTTVTSAAYSVLPALITRGSVRLVKSTIWTPPSLAATKRRLPRISTRQGRPGFSTISVVSLRLVIIRGSVWVL